MYSQDDLQPVNRNYIIIGIVALIIFTFTIGGILYKKEEPKKPITSTQPNNSVVDNGNQANLAKYDEDSDGDKIPNFLEEYLGLNIYSSEINECQKSVNICQESPLNSKYNISIILDASTSMKIVGNKEPKINEIRNSVKEALSNDLKKDYYKSSVYSFGNKGNIDNIPDNESCVSILRHKSSTTIFTEEDFKTKFLNQYVPNGKSPIAFTLDQVGKTLNKNEKNMIVLITDGMDDCNGDVKRVITELKNSGTVNKSYVATYYSNEDANIYMKEAFESTNGYFAQNPNIKDFLVFSSKNFIKEQWCKTSDLNKLKTCIDNKYKTALSYLNDQKNNRNLGEDEKVKIANTQSVMSYFIESNFRKFQTDLDGEFNKYFEEKK